MKLFHLIFCLLLAVSLKADLQWQTTTPSYNDILFRFQMPGSPDEQDLETRYDWGTLHSWKVEAEGNVYFVIVAEKNKILPLWFLVFPKNSEIVSVQEVNNQEYVVLTDPDYPFSLASIQSNEDIWVALVTKTQNKESPEHIRFIESFAFIK